jgi:ribosome recycling factor
MEKEIIAKARQQMEKSIEALQKDFSKVRTGRASVTLLDGVRVDYYGTPTPLNQLATLAVPEARQITIQPWDQSVLKEIEKAIQKADLGFTPNNDGKLLRVNIPPLTEERRRDLAKQIKKMAEAAKVAIRNQRRDINDELKVVKNDKKINEDVFHKAQDDVQKVTDEFIKKCDELSNQKEKEILEF